MYEKETSVAATSRQIYVAHTLPEVVSCVVSPASWNSSRPKPVVVVRQITSTLVELEWVNHAQGDTATLLVRMYAPAAGLVSTAAVGNVGAGTDTLQSTSIPANTLPLCSYRIRAWGTAANNANNKFLVMKFGTQDVLTQLLSASEFVGWVIDVVVLRTGADLQDICAELRTFGTTPTPKFTLTAGTQTETAAIVVKCTGAATDDNDIVQEGLIVQAF